MNRFQYFEINQKESWKKSQRETKSITFNELKKKEFNLIQSTLTNS